MFTDLPSHIHELITSFLDYFPLTNLCQTNHYFHNLITRNSIKDALLNLEQRAAGEGRPLDSFRGHLLEGQWTMISTRLPCYECLRSLPAKRYFLPSQITGEYALGEAAASKRKCGGCYYSRRATWLTKSELFFTEGGTWIDCVQCTMTKRFAERTGGWKWSSLAWTRGHRCFDCYWADCGTESGEVKLVPYELDGRNKILLEVPIEREELKNMLKGLKYEEPDSSPPWLVKPSLSWVGRAA